MKILKNKYILLLILLVFVYRPFFTSGLRVANDHPYTFIENIKEINIPQLWSSRFASGFGEYVISSLWAWPNDLFYSIGANLGMTPGLLIRLLRFLPIILIGIWAINLLSKYYQIKGWAKIISTLFFLTNTYLLLIIDGGQLTIGLAYVWFPLAYLKFITGLKETPPFQGGDELSSDMSYFDETQYDTELAEVSSSFKGNCGLKSEKDVIKSISGNVRDRIIGGLYVTVLGFFDIRFIYILVILLFLNFIYELLFLKRTEYAKYFFSWFKSGLISAILFIGLNFFWILPSVLVKAPSLPETYQRVSQASFLSFANLGHALFLLQPHWYKNVFGKVSPLLPAFALIPIMIFLAPILKKRSKTVGFWLIVALAGIFLVKGTNPPFGYFYSWFFTNIPGFSLFRDPSKFFFLVSLSFSLLIGIATSKLMQRFDWKLKIGQLNILIIPLLLTTYFLLLIHPVYTGKMTGIFSEPQNINEFFSVAGIIKSDKNFGRILWIPSLPPLGYSSPTHPTLEASRLIKKRSFSIGTVGSYEVFNFLREAPFMGEIFKIAGIKYISYPYPDTKREDLQKDNIDYYYTFLNQLTNLPWIEKQLTDAQVSLLSVKETKDHLFLSEKIWFVVGSDRIYWDLVKLPNFDLSGNALLFVEEYPGLINRVSEIPQAKILLYDKSLTDLAASFIDGNKFMFPANLLSTDPDASGWWKRETPDLINWRAFLQEKYGIDNLDFDYGGGWAIAEGDNSKFKIQNSKLKSGNILLVRAMKSSRGGKIEFWQGDERVGEINSKIDIPQKVEIKLTGHRNIPDQITTYDKAEFNWYEIGKLTADNHSLTIKTFGDINVINTIVALDKDEWFNLNSLVDKNSIVVWNQLNNQEKEKLVSGDINGKVTYNKVSPTHYRINIEGIEKPETLVFSETYDPLWELNGTKSFPLYSLVNGFEVSSRGEYDLYFSAQKYVLPGLLISVITLGITVIFLFRTRNAKRKG